MLAADRSWRGRLASVLAVSVAAALVTLANAGEALAAVPACQEHVYVHQTTSDGQFTGPGTNSLGPGEFIMNTRDSARNYIFMAGQTRPRRSATFRFVNSDDVVVRQYTTTASRDNGVIYQEPNVIPYNFTQPGDRIRVFADFHTRCGGDDVMRFNVFVGTIQTFPAGPVDVHPKYLVLSVAYAPPGAESTVDYGSSTTLGSKLSFSSSFKSEVSLTNTGTTERRAISTSNSFTQKASDSSALSVADSIEKSESNNIIIPGPASSLDGINHNEDIFFVWLNPRFTTTATSPTSVETSGFSVDPRDPVSPNMDVVQLSVRQLKNPSQIDPGTASRLQRSWSPTGALATADFNDILARNPFADGGTTIDPARFDLLPGTFNYRPAAPGGQPITQNFSLGFKAASSLSLTSTSTTAIAFDMTSTDTRSLETLKETIKTERKESQTFEVTNGVTLEASTAVGQTTTLSLKGPTTGYQGPTAVQVYQDNLFGTLMFAFAPVATFRIAAPSPDKTVSQGTSATFPITTASDFGFTGDVSFDPNVSGLPAGAQASFAPTSVPVGDGSTLTVTTSPQTPPGSYPLTVTANSGLIRRHLTVNLTVNALPFTLTATPSSRTVASGESTTYTVSVSRTGGFSGPVQLSGPGGLPPGASATFSPTTITGDSTSTLTVTTSPSTPAVARNLTIFGTGGGVTRTASVGLVVDNARDFGLGVTPQATGVAAGDTATYTVTTTAINGFGGDVNLAVSGHPAGTTPSFSVNPIAGAGSSTLSIPTTTATTPGDYLITVTGTSGGLSHSQTVILTISDFTLESTPSTQSVQAGGSASYTVDTAPVAGFDDTINLSVTGVPAGVGADFDDPSVTPGSDTTLSVSIGGSAEPGSYPLTITGTSGELSHSETVTLNVMAPAPPPPPPPPAVPPVGLVAVHSSKCLDVPGGALQDGVQLQQYGCHGGTNQQWRLEPVGADTYLIKSVHSGKCVDVAGWSTSDGGVVHQWSCHGGTNQQWRASAAPQPGQTVTLTAVHSDKCLDVEGASRADGGRVHQWSCHGGANQQWLVITPGTAPPPPPPVCGQSWGADTVFPVDWACSNAKGTLIMQSDGNLVIYSEVGTPLWATGTVGHPGAVAVFQGDGNLVIYDPSGMPLWASNTGGVAPGGQATFQDDGNFVIYTAAGYPVWASNTFGEPAPPPPPPPPPCEPPLICEVPY